VLASKPNVTTANAEYAVEQLGCILDVMVRIIIFRLRKKPIYFTLFIMNIVHKVHNNKAEVRCAGDSCTRIQK
jgi:hypothetical protein